MQMLEKNIFGYSLCVIVPSGLFLTPYTHYDDRGHCGILSVFQK